MALRTIVFGLILYLPVGDGFLVPVQTWILHSEESNG